MGLLRWISDFFYEVGRKLHHLFGLDRRKASFTGNRRARMIFIICGVITPLVNLCVFWLPSNINTFVLSFQVSTPEGVKFGFDYFEMLFREFQNPFSQLSEALINTFKFFFLNMFIKLPLSFMFSYFIYKKIAGYKVFRYIFYLPSIISSVVMTSLVMFMAGPEGPITKLWECFTGEAPLFFNDSDYALKSIMVYCLWSGFGTSMIFYTASMIRIPESVIEYGTLEGVGFLKEVRYLIIPLVWPILSIFILEGFIDIFSASGPILLFTNGGYNTYTISFWIYAKTVGISGANHNYASAVGLFFGLISTPIALFVKWLTDRIETVEY